MANKSVLSTQQAPKGGAPRTGFSLSQNYTFTAAAGMLLPAHKQFLNIGERVSGVPSAFIRTEPLLAPAMADLDVYVDLFFVPMRHLFSMFDAWFTQVDDAPSALWNGSAWENALPVVSATVTDTSSNEYIEAFGWMHSFAWNHLDIHNPNIDQLTDRNYSANFGFGAHRLAQMLGYNAQGYFRSLLHTDDYDYSTYPADNIMPEMQTRAKNTHQSPFCPYYFMAYQKIYYDYYRDSEFEANNVKAYNLDDVMNVGSKTFSPISSLETWNARCEMFELRYRNRSKDYFNAVHPSPLFNSIGMLPNAADNLAQAKNWLTAQHPSLLAGPQKSVYINTYPGGELVGDDVDFATETPSWIGRSIWQPNSEGAQFEPIVGVQSQRTLQTQNVLSYGGEGLLKTSHSHPIDFAKAIEDGYIGFQPSGDQGIALAQVRTAFALDKLLRLSNRAGRHTDDQMLAQFGVKIPQGVSNEVYHIKTYHTLFHIGEVVQSATTVDASGADVPLGEMAGRGVAVLNSNDGFEFTAPCHGIFMAILSIAPRYKYIFGIEKDGLKVYLEDFFRPAYDNLGMQPMLKEELGINSADVTSVWQYRYMEDKIKFDKTSLAFAVVSKNPWSFVTVPNEQVVNGSTVEGHSWQKVAPYDTNNLFTVQYVPFAQYPDENTLGNDCKTPCMFLSNYLRDPFTIDFNMKCSKVSQMSTYGEPALGGL